MLYLKTKLVKLQLGLFVITYKPKIYLVNQQTLAQHTFKQSTPTNPHIF